ncbi:MAG: hypothetical protein JWQ95_6122 [Sphaerisporangium sp.]|nr:hypothetical protein [Sphaerisporangium sp.]
MGEPAEGVGVDAPAEPGHGVDAGPARVFLARAARDRLYAQFHLIAFRGLRRGESCGIRWTDLDLDAGAPHGGQAAGADRMGGRGGRPEDRLQRTAPWPSTRRASRRSVRTGSARTRSAWRGARHGRTPGASSPGRMAPPSEVAHEAAEAIAALVPRKIAVGEASETAGPPSVSPVNFPVPTDSPKKRTPRSLGVRGEPTRGIEPLTYGLQVGRGMSIDVSRGP